MKISCKIFTDIFGLLIFLLLIFLGFLTTSFTNILVSKSLDCPSPWNQLIAYGTNPFSDGKPKSFSTGVEIQSEIVSDMIGAKERLGEQFAEFVKERLIDDTKGFFKPMSRNKICTGIKRKKIQKYMDILKISNIWIDGF